MFYPQTLDKSLDSKRQSNKIRFPFVTLPKLVSFLASSISFSSLVTVSGVSTQTTHKTAGTKPTL